MWMKEFSRHPELFVSDEQVRIRDVRDFAWNEHGSTPNWITRTLEPSDLKEAYVVIEQFRKWGAAHTFVCFTTSLDPICVSVDARRKEGETYSLFKGLTPYYETIYFFTTGRDFLGQRLDYRKRELEICKLELDRDEVWEFFRSLAIAAERNQGDPATYHTIRRNCTTEICKAIPRKVRAPLMPKYLGRQLMKAGLVHDCALYDRENRPPFLP